MDKYWGLSGVILDELVLGDTFDALGDSRLNAVGPNCIDLQVLLLHSPTLLSLGYGPNCGEFSRDCIGLPNLWSVLA